MLNKPTTCQGCPLYKPPFGKSTGFSYAVGSGLNGVMIVAEALGKDEEIEGMALVGKSGYQLFQQLARVGIEREGFTIHNVLSCRPPDNKLTGEVYEKEAIERCSPNLDAAIEKAKVVAKENNKTFVIVTLGVIPFKRILGLDSKRDADLLKLDYYGYPFWSDRYNCYVYAAPHPAYLLRGKTQLWPVVQFVFKRALEVAQNGLVLEQHDYLLDPEPFIFDQWVDGYVNILDAEPDTPLSYDIETPYKKKTKDEEELGKEEDADHTILRIAFSYWADGRTHTVSVKWSAEFMAGIERLFSVAKYILGWNSTNYDYPRVSHHLAINGIDLDGMVAWHILNTSLPKSLAFVSPYYNQNTLTWKHLSESQPAFYNAKDAHMALVNYMGIKKDLINNRLWHVFERHVLKINEVLKYMTGIGIPLDLEERQKAEDKLQKLLDGIEAAMEEAVPQAARKYKVFKKVPKDTTGMVEVDGEKKTTKCPQCGELDIKATHFKSIGKKALKGGDRENPCVGFKAEKVTIPSKLWAKPLEFKVSKLGLTNYQKALKHQAIINRKEKKVTFNADAIQMLIKKYPKDRLYPRILEHRETQKLLSTYVGVTNEVGKVIGGMEFDANGRVHTTYTHNPSTLRFASESPNLQNLPRPSKDPNALANLIRNLIVAPEGSIFYARDFSGIEAVLTGYFALDPSYIRLAKRDIHTYYTVYALYELEGGARIKSSDLPNINWEDGRLFDYLGQLKKEFGAERNSLYKHLVHAANFMQGASGARDKIFSETGIMYETKTVQKVMDVYYSLFPKIKQWHKNVLQEAEKDGYLRNPFDYVHRFSKVYDYKKEFGEWVKKPGPDANKAIAFKPQSTAAGIIKEAMLRLYFDRFQSAGQYLRLQVHDELFFECPEGYWHELDKIVKEEMERPVTQMKMPASWGMGESLVVLTEEKVGRKWGEMR